MPNAGKSTLLNAMIGEQLVITNRKAQTTRHRIKGILNQEDCQLVFSDTPGIIKDSAYLLQDQMMKVVSESMEDADVLLVVMDVNNPKAKDELQPIVKLKDIPVVVALNKIDQSEQDQLEAKVEAIQKAFGTDLIYPISALNNFNIDQLLAKLKELSPEHPPYYDQESISDENVRFHVAEIIRDQMLSQFKKEVPYSAEVVVQDYKEEEKIDKIYATIYLERDSQRVIVLGKGGSSIKRLGTESRKVIEKFLEKKVYLQLSIKIRKNWRKDELQLKRFGYIKK